MGAEKIEIKFGGGFMYVFDDQREPGRWRSLTAGTVKTEAGGGVAPHKLILKLCKGSVHTDLESITYERHQAWDLAGCRVEVEPDQVGAGVLAPLDPDAPPPDLRGPAEAWHNWKWVLNPVALHRGLGHSAAPPGPGWPDRLDASVVVESGIIVPDPGFPTVVLTVASSPVTVPLTNETRWSGNPGATELVLYVSGAREGRLAFTPEGDLISLQFRHDERGRARTQEIADLSMIYGLIDVASAQRITRGVVSNGLVDTPGKTCGSARFILE